MRKSIKDSLDINGIMKRRCGESCDGPVIAQAVVSSCTSEQACAARWCQYINELFDDSRLPQPIAPNLDGPSMLKSDVDEVVKRHFRIKNGIK